MDAFVVTVSDASGRRVALGENAESIDLSNLQNGMYFVRIQQGDRTITTQKVALIR